jgi:dihydroxy-acid dehydratase
MSDVLNPKSRSITAGIERSPNRAMLRAVGFSDTDFEKPIVGVANGHSTMNPCNAGIQPLADRACTALFQAGAMPQTFGFPTVTDGISMGTEGMKYSLVSREVIAEAIEVAAASQCMDGLLVVGGCDKNMPGAMIGMLRLNIPSVFVYAGTIKPGTWKGVPLTIVSPFEAVGAFRAGKMSEEDFIGIEKNACPSVGACGGMYTANTMSSAFEALGMSLLGSSQMASPDPEKADSAADSARVLVAAIRRNLKPRDIVTRKSIENAMALVMATGGSTNAVLHFLAIAHAAEVPFSIDDVETIRRKVPVLCNLKPSGQYVAVDLHRAGGVPQVLKMLLVNGLLHGDALTVTGETMAEALASVPDSPRADQDVIRPFDRPLYAEGHLAVLKGNLAPEGAVAKITGLKNPVITGPARVFNSEQEAMEAILADRIQAGDALSWPQGRTGDAGNAGTHQRHHRQGSGRKRGLHHRWPLLGRHLGHGGRACDPRGVRWRPDCPGRRGRYRHHRRPPPGHRTAGRRGHARRAPRALDAPRTALYPRGARQVCAHGLQCLARCGH